MRTPPSTAAGSAPADLATLARLQQAFAATSEQVDPDLAVPWCGDWRVRDLVEHLTQVHHWAAAQARRVVVVPLDAAVDDPAGRYRRSAAELLQVLTATEPDAPAWTLDESRVAAFWHRRQVHETLVHLWDLRSAAALGTAEPPALWADTVDEVVTVMTPRQVRLGRLPAPEGRIELRAHDVGAGWTLPAAAAAPTTPVAVLDGPAEALALLLWGRTRLDDQRLTVIGDRGALADLLAGPLTP
jgi:uncharacterized protein (TIGR03083 family)